MAHTGAQHMAQSREETRSPPQRQPGATIQDLYDSVVKIGTVTDTIAKSPTRPISWR